MDDLHRDVRRKGGAPLPSRKDLAVEVLGFLAEDPERLVPFMALTGSTPDLLRRTAASPAFTRAVLGYLASDEALLVAFAAAQGYPPERVGALVQNRDGEDTSS